MYIYIYIYGYMLAWLFMASRLTKVVPQGRQGFSLICEEVRLRSHNKQLMSEGSIHLKCFPPSTNRGKESRSADAAAGRQTDRPKTNDMPIYLLKPVLTFTDNYRIVFSPLWSLASSFCIVSLSSFCEKDSAEEKNVVCIGRSDVRATGSGDGPC